MNKKDIFDAFNGEISKKAIIQKDGAWRIVGKWCEIERVGDLWDIFICNPDNMTDGLGQRKVHNIIDRLKIPPINGTFRILNGEAYTQVSDINLILSNLSLLGIRRKRRLSEKTRHEHAERLKKFHKRASQ